MPRRVAKCSRGRKCGRTCIKKKYYCYTPPVPRSSASRSSASRSGRRLGDLVVDNSYVVTDDGKRPTKNPWAAAERRSGLKYKWVKIGAGEWTRRSSR